MLPRLAFLFVVVPLLELFLLIRMGQWIGLWPTLALVLVTGVAGAALTRSQGIRALSAFQAELGAGRIPGATLADGLAVLVGGAFLLTPGLLTDVAGFALLIPGSRRWIRGRVMARIRRMQERGTLRIEVVTPFHPGFGPSGDRLSDDAARAAGLDPRDEIQPRS